MIGRTNIPFGVSGAVDGVTIADLPTHLSSLTAAANSGRVVLGLSYSDTNFVSGVDVLYKTGSFPTSPTDGECVSSSGAVTEITVEGLTNGTEYFFRVYLWRLIGGVKYYQTDETNAKIYATPSAVGISGIEPAAIGENYIVIDQSGTFSLDIPEEITTVTACVVGGGNAGNAGYDHGDEDNEYRGGDGGSGGYVYSVNIPAASYNDDFTCAIGTGGRPRTGRDDEENDPSGGYTSLYSINLSTIKSTSGTYVNGGQGSTEYHADGYNGKNGVLTAYGYVGSSGGGGCVSNTSFAPGTGGIGAGRGGQGDEVGQDAIGYGCAGGGGGEYVRSGSQPYRRGGKGKQGCIIIEWA